MLRSIRIGSATLRSIHSGYSPISHRLSQPSRTQSWTQSLPKRVMSQRPFSTAPRRFQEAAAVEQEQQTSSEPTEELTKFEQLAQRRLINPRIIDTIVNRMNIHTMTDVQRLTLNHCLDGSDVIGQARTGTGKTLAFLMPIIQRILKDGKLERGGRDIAQMDIKALIISPTRELAEQIAVEAKRIVQGTSVRVQCAVGGTQKSRHLALMQRQGCHILVGTPGRVLDILEDRTTGVNLDNIDTFVLDEADRLLDIGFLPAIESIQNCMPDQRDRPRQTLMFSATVPKSVVALVKTTLKPDFKFIRTVDPDEAPTHERVPQKVVFTPGLQNQIPAVLEIATKAMDAHRNDPKNTMPFKAIVYFGSTSEVGLAHSIFRNMRAPGGEWGHPLAPLEIYQMSSKLEQAKRTRESEGFRRAESAILLSSDVTARGMDFPNVSHVIQIGQPRQPDDYVHRIGRTGRAGKSGEGWLIVSEDERSEIASKFRNTGINLQPERLHTAELDMTRAAQVPANVAKILQLVESGVRSTPFGVKSETYRALFGTLTQQHPKRPKQLQIDMMNDLAKYGWGLHTPPPMMLQTVQKLGFAGCEGINIDQDSPFRGRPSGGARPFNNRLGNKDSYDPRDPFGTGARGGVGVFGGRSSGATGEFRNRGNFGDREGGRGREGRFRDRDDGFGRGRDTDDFSRRPDFGRGKGDSSW